MADAVKGYGGSGKVALAPTVANVDIGLIVKWENSGERKTSERGPYVGNAVIKKSPGGRIETTSIEVEVPEGRSAGQTLLIDAYESGESVNAIIETDSGYTITITAGLVEKRTLGTEAKETQTVKFEISGETAVTAST